MPKNPIAAFIPLTAVSFSDWTPDSIIWPTIVDFEHF